MLFGDILTCYNTLHSKKKRTLKFSIFWPRGWPRDHARGWARGVHRSVLKNKGQKTNVKSFHLNSHLSLNYKYWLGKREYGEVSYMYETSLRSRTCTRPQRGLVHVRDLTIFYFTQFNICNQTSVEKVSRSVFNVEFENNTHETLWNLFDNQIDCLITWLWLNTVCLFFWILAM
jgi:hypothetical protein